MPRGKSPNRTPKVNVPITSGSVNEFLLRASARGGDAQFETYGLGLIVGEGSRRIYAPLFLRLVMERALIDDPDRGGIPDWFNTHKGRQGFRDVHQAAIDGTEPATKEAAGIIKLVGDLGSTALTGIATEAREALRDEGLDDAASFFNTVGDTVRHIVRESGVADTVVFGESRPSAA